MTALKCTKRILKAATQSWIYTSVKFTELIFPLSQVSLKPVVVSWLKWTGDYSVSPKLNNSHHSRLQTGTLLYRYAPYSGTNFPRNVKVPQYWMQAAYNCQNKRLWNQYAGIIQLIIIEGINKMSETSMAWVKQELPSNYSLFLFRQSRGIWRGWWVVPWPSCKGVPELLPQDL